MLLHLRLHKLFGGDHDLLEVFFNFGRLNNALLVAIVELEQLHEAFLGELQL